MSQHTLSVPMYVNFVGCDYTIGVHGVGIVNALEVVKVFNTFESLVEFREWATDPGRIK